MSATAVTSYSEKGRRLVTQAMNHDKMRVTPRAKTYSARTGISASEKMSAAASTRAHSVRRRAGRRAGYSGFMHPLYHGFMKIWPRAREKFARARIFLQTFGRPPPGARK